MHSHKGLRKEPFETSRNKVEYRSTGRDGQAENTQATSYNPRQKVLGQ